MHFRADFSSSSNLLALLAGRMQDLSNGDLEKRDSPSPVTVFSGSEKAIRRKRPDMLSDGVILLHDNTHTARKTQELLRKFKWEVYSHLCSPDSAPNLGSKHLSGSRFSSESDVKTVLEK
ncbi:hypothetical protein AVEN_68170-1 [Araneus ventricosus]|uniref:Uncharacterized protein n=1 Tax=Araneus ventricosus TaxID=182803 RepID=A0A4Y2PLU4_ARAVE|nr:hypothetical protein AVEN_68170-1 [Araneus ventricosus]